MNELSNNYVQTGCYSARVCENCGIMMECGSEKLGQVDLKKKIAYVAGPCCCVPPICPNCKFDNCRYRRENIKFPFRYYKEDEKILEPKYLYSTNNPIGPMVCSECSSKEGLQLGLSLTYKCLKCGHVGEFVDNQLKWDVRFLKLAKEVSSWSKDPSTKVGAVLVNDDKHVVGMGYNGFAKGVNDDKERYENRELKYKLVVHAEVNAILQAGHRTKGCALYVYPSFMLPPICHECCKVAIQAGIKTVVGFTPNENDERVKRWKDSIETSRTMCTEAGISWRGIKENEI